MSPSPLAELDIDPSQSRAVLIGTSTYETDFKSLPPVDNNLEELKNLLIQPEIFGLDPDHVKTLHNTSNLINIKQTIADSGREASSLFLFYYTGHGALKADGFYLTVPETTSKDPDITGLNWSEVRRALEKSKAQVKIVILDCCYAGKALKNILSNPEQWLEQQVATDDQGVHFDPEGLVGIASSPGNSVSYGFGDKQYTEFTGRLIGILDNGIEGAGPVLSPDDVFTALYASIKKTRESASDLDLPKPQIIGSGFARDAKVFRNRTHEFDPEVWRVEYEDRIDKLVSQVGQLQSQNAGLREQLADDVRGQVRSEAASGSALRRLSEWSDAALELNETAADLLDVALPFREESWEAGRTRLTGDLEVLTDEIEALASDETLEITLQDRRLAHALKQMLADSRDWQSWRDARGATAWAPRRNLPPMAVQIGFISLFLFVVAAALYFYGTRVDDRFYPWSWVTAILAVIGAFLTAYLYVRTRMAVIAVKEEVQTSGDEL